MRCAIGIDLGGTHVRVGVVAHDGALRSVERASSECGGDPGILVERLGELIRRVGADARAADLVPTVALALPGALDPERRRVLRAVNLPFLEGFPLADALERACGMSALLDSDVAAAALAEHRQSDDRAERLVCMTIGTGIGAAVVLNGAIVRHTRNGGGHLGHLIVDSSPDAPPCGCGIRGCLETRCSGPAIQRAAGVRALPESLPRLQEAYDQGSEPVAAFLSDITRYLAIGLSQIVHLYAPDRIVIGGGAAAALPVMVELASRHFDVLRGKLVPPHLRIQPATLGDDAGVIGAGLLAIEHGGPS